MTGTDFAPSLHLVLRVVEANILDSACCFFFHVMASRLIVRPIGREKCHGRYDRPTGAPTAATVCVGGPHRGRRGTKARSASFQTVRHSHQWGARNPRALLSTTSNLDDPCDRGGEHGRSGPKPSVRDVLGLVGYPFMASRGCA